MATDKEPKLDTFLAEEDIHDEADYYKLLMLTATGGVKFTDGITDVPIGVAYSMADNGGRITVATGGRVLVRCGETLSPKDLVGGSADGEAALIEATDYTAVPFGRMIEGGADGEVGSMEIIGAGAPILKSA